MNKITTTTVILHLLRSAWFHEALVNCKCFPKFRFTVIKQSKGYEYLTCCPRGGLKIEPKKRVPRVPPPHPSPSQVVQEQLEVRRWDGGMLENCHRTEGSLLYIDSLMLIELIIRTWSSRTLIKHLMDNMEQSEMKALL